MLRFAWSTRVYSLGVIFGLAALGCDSGDESRTIERVGSVSVGSSADAAFTPKPFGMFYRSADRGDQPSCDVKTQAGSCRSWVCDDAVYTAPSTLKTIDAGAVRVLAPEQEVELLREDDGFYRQAEAPTTLWKAGDSLTISVEGSADFPAFETPLLAPEPLSVSTPEVGAEPLLIDSTQNLAIEWSGPTSGLVFVAISPETVAEEGAEPSVTPGVDCAFSATAGGAFVPASMLKALPKPPGLTQYYLDVVTYSVTSVVSGDAWLDFRATWAGLTTPATVE